MIVARVAIVSSGHHLSNDREQCVEKNADMWLQHELHVNASSMTAARDVVAEIRTGNSASVSNSTIFCTAAPDVAASIATPILMNSPTTWHTVNERLQADELSSVRYYLARSPTQKGKRRLKIRNDVLGHDGLNAESKRIWITGHDSFDRQQDRMNRKFLTSALLRI